MKDFNVYIRTGNDYCNCSVRLYTTELCLKLCAVAVRGCRFFARQAIYEDEQRRKPERLLGIAENLLACSGYDEISLSSLSTDFADFVTLRTDCLK